MAEKKYYWLKLKDTFFNQKEIKKLRRIAGGDTYTIIYLKMQLLSIKNEGRIEFEGTEDTFEEQLSLEIDEDLENIQMTLAFLYKNKLLEQTSEDTFLLTKVSDVIGKESSSAERVRRHRAKKKLVECGNAQIEENVEKNTKALQCNASVTESNALVTKSNTEKETEKKKDIEINIKLKKEQQQEKKIKDNSLLLSEENLKDSSGSDSAFIKFLAEYLKISYTESKEIATAAGFNMEQIMKVYEYAKNKKVDSLVPYMIKLVKPGAFKEPKPVKQEYKPNKFNNFEGRNYTPEQYDDLEKKLLGWDDDEE